MLCLSDSILFIESPVQMVTVLIIALLVFGPKKLPEIGKQIGSALRELRKAAGEVSRSFTTEYEPDTSAYTSSESSDYNRSASYYTPPPGIETPVDLTDYTLTGTLAGVPREPEYRSVDSEGDSTDGDTRGGGPVGGPPQEGAAA